MMLSKLRLGRTAVILVPMLWLAAFFFIPFLVVFKISLAEAMIAVPPYSPLLQWDSSNAYLTFKVTFGNYLYLFESRFYLDAYLSSLKIAAISTFFALLIGFPIAYLIARSRPTMRTILLALVILPFWTSFLLRVYAWMALLKKNGLVNDFLLATGIIDQPIQILQTDFAVYLGIVYTYLPFMILPLYTTLEKMDLNLLDAAQDLGAKPYQSFFLVTLPLAKPGIIAGCLLVFIPAVGEYVIPALLGGSDTLMIGRVLWDEFFLNRDWPLASAVAVVMLIVLVGPIMFMRNSNKEAE
ncbi:MAG: ABC transporter permease subunit [Gammaproteobacteria bacterium]|jgi:putrescine transport system permease protein|nr:MULTISPECIES: ABC transporter permease subunit [Marinomonas]MBU1293989.1 ABC transporter permease subunit [Gammaproteobacteria bacterium]MBU1468507.1 ABC transporter permease subunit [Gammaproteobacteria bacterium]MBU2022137.1 ABC transporter permease subunit [Gammaproteobacteria bacterium]MBU2239875.1 ABC transporter permease subunit [Gammaproteobacteria bacterium]MBU2320970.1 ABC transporter permease subunit [Gammaproteobacteria bacterium]|tara:strand:+ start:3862 stop:4752 length:891 start_codon:yes stop_codon:yes gene_type:complete